jgi:hypothetical protein
VCPRIGGGRDRPGSHELRRLPRTTGRRQHRTRSIHRGASKSYARAGLVLSALLFFRRPRGRVD